MAYIRQEDKKVIAESMKPILKKYGIKGTLSIDNGTSINLNIKSGVIDFFKNYNETLENTEFTVTDYLSVNLYWIHEYFSGEARAFLLEAKTALKSAGYYDHSDIQSDYFDVAYYMNINIGKWNKPYILT